MASSSRRSRGGGEVGVATRDALRGLALQFETGAFVDARERDRRARREAADAASEALRTFQMCASPKLSREENLELVLRPVLRNFCARLLARLGRVADRGVDADAARAARGVALELARAPGRDGELELMAAIERRLERIAEDVFAGRCGVAAREGDAPDDAAACASAAEECAAALTDALRPRENVDALVTPRVLGFAQRVAYASEMSRRKSGTIPGDVPGEVVQIAVEVCEALAADAARLERDGDAAPAHAGSGLGAFAFGAAALTALARLGLRAEPVAASAAEEVDARNRRAVARLRREMAEGLAETLRRAAPRVRAAAASAADRAERRRAAAAAIRRDRPFNENDRPTDETDSNAGSYRVGSDVDGEVGASAERNAPAETKEAVSVSPAAQATRATDPRNARRSRDVFTITRAEACFAVRACDTPEECRATLAEPPVRSALAPVAESLARGEEACAPAPAVGDVVSGEQVVKDWLREGDGLTLFVDVPGDALAASSASAAPHAPPPRVFHESASVAELGPGFAGLEEDKDARGEPPRREEKLATGPFQAHFVSACGALADALHAAGTCRGVRGKGRKREKPREIRAATAREAAKSRWLEPPTARRDGDARDGDERRRLEDEKESAACAAAAARVMLAGSRTVRGGDALDFVMRVFAEDDAKEGTRAAEWTARSVDPAVSNRVLRPAGPSASASVRRARVLVTARDVFVVSRATPREHDARDDPGSMTPVPWAAVATRTTQTLVFDAAAERLELASRSVGLDPDVCPRALDGLLRELEDTRRCGASKRPDVNRTKTVGPRGFDDGTAAAAAAAARRS